MKSPHWPATLRSVAALLTCLALAACSAPRQHEPLPLDSFPYSDGNVVATQGDTVTVLMNQQLVKIRLEGFADEGASVAATVRKSPAHARFASDSVIAARR